MHEHVDNIIPEGDNKNMPAAVRELMRSGDAGEELLEQWNNKRPGYMEGTQHAILMLYGGLCDSALTFTEDEEHTNDVKELLGEADWSKLSELRERYLNTHMTPQEWEASSDRAELYRILGKIVMAPQFKQYFPIKKESEESGTVH